MTKQRDSEATKETLGEGNRAADRAYRDAASRHASSGRDERAARRAKEALEDRDEADELERAEAEGKARARTMHDQRGESG